MKSGIRQWIETACGAGLALAAFGAGEVSAAPKIAAAQVVAWQDAGQAVLLIDTRPPHRFEQKHARGAVSVPAFVVGMKSFPRDARIVVYDDGAGSVEAGRAAQALESKGHTQVHVVDGGLTAWEAENLPIVALPGSTPLPFVEAISVDQLDTLLAEGARPNILDLTPPKARTALKAGRAKAPSIPGARVVDTAARLDQSVSALAATDLIIVFDDGSGDAQRKAEELRRRGFRTVKYLYGGTAAWQAKRLEKKVGE